MRKINLYYHGGSANHGCEAIVRSTAKILGLRPVLHTAALKEELRYHVDQVAEIAEDCYIPVRKGSLDYLVSALDHKLHGHDYQFIRRGHRSFLNRISKGDICMSIGGDNYCYSGADRLGYYNRMLHERGCKTILWGCSVEPSALTESVVADMQRYDLIIVRESLSLKGLKQAGIIDNVLLCADPAFQLEMEKMSLPDGFTSENTVGINASPLVVDYGNLVMENYIEMIRYILEYTDFRVLLIPHVVKPDSDDRNTLKKLYDFFEDTGRIALVEDQGCMALKGIISQCRFFIGARTHATIAAYSTCVPTLAVGYSIKSRGIAWDIFGTDEHYAIPVQDFADVDGMKHAFSWLQEHELEIRRHLEKIMPEYKRRALLAGAAVRSVMTE